MITNKEWKIVDTAMQDVLNLMRLEERNTGYCLEFDIDGYWIVYDPQTNKTLKRYRKLVNAINYLMPY